MIIVCINKLLIDGAVAAVEKNCCVQHGLHEKCSCVVWLMLICDSACLDAQATMIFSRLCAHVATLHHALPAVSSAHTAQALLLSDSVTLHRSSCLCESPGLVGSLTAGTEKCLKQNSLMNST